MKDVKMFVAPGYSKKTGYYFRCIRDKKIMENLGYQVEIIHLNSIYNILNSIYLALKGSNHINFCENYATTLPVIISSFFNPSIIKKTIAVNHGSLEELNIDPLGKIKRVAYKFFESRFIKKNGKMLCVSNTMINGLKQQYPNGVFLLSPNIPSLEFIEEITKTQSKTIKDSLFINGEKKIVCYCGNTQPWQKVDLLIELIKTKSEKLHFLILTSDMDYFHKRLDGYESYFTVLCVDNNKVPMYLKSSDFLYLIRDNNETNHYSCPTKAIEYIYSEVPMIISEQVGDISSLVSSNGNGIVINENEYNKPKSIIKTLEKFKVESIKPSIPYEYTLKYQNELYRKILDM